jgi:FAD:protein FMN transferase
MVASVAPHSPHSPKILHVLHRPRGSRASLLLAIAIALLCLAGCSDQRSARHEFRRVVMGVPATIVLYAPSSERAEEGAARALARLAELNAIFSDYQHDSELNRLCRAPHGVPQRVSPDLFEILGVCAELHEATGGDFDITVGPAVALWREARVGLQLPSLARLEEARARMDAHAIRLDPSARSVTLSRPDLRLDLGGIAKGYAAQQALCTLKQHGLPRSMVALAGDIALGDPPPESGSTPGWRIVLPTLAANPPRVLVLANTCVSTSGDSQQFVDIAGVRYSHIIDPRTGLGATDSTIVTVIGPDGARTDALATALSIRRPTEHALFLRDYPGYHAIVTGGISGR